MIVSPVPTLRSRNEDSDLHAQANLAVIRTYLQEQFEGVEMTERSDTFKLANFPLSDLQSCRPVCGRSREHKPPFPITKTSNPQSSNAAPPFRAPTDSGEEMQTSRGDRGAAYVNN